MKAAHEASRWIARDRVGSEPLVELGQRVHMRAESRLHQLELLVSHLFDRPLTDDEVGHARSYAGDLASRLGLLGVALAAAKLRRITELFDRNEATSNDAAVAHRRPELAIQLAALSEEVRSHLEEATADLQLLSRGPETVAVVGARGETTDAILWSCAAGGLAVDYVPAHDVDRIRDLDPDGMVQVLDDADQIGDVSTRLAAVHPDVPLLVVAPRLESSEQVSLARCASLVVPRRTHPQVVAEELQRLIRSVRIQPTVGLYGPGADAMAEQLQDHGLVASVFGSGPDLGAAVVDGRIRAVLCAPQPDGTPSYGLVSLLRSERRGRTIVIGCIGADPAERSRALALGADCYWTSTSSIGEVAGELRARLTRNAVLDAALAEVDDNVALPWPIGRVMIQRMIADAGRAKMPVAFALLYLRAGSGVDDRLARAFRRSDVVTRRDADSVVIALRGADRSTITRRLQSTLESLRPRVTQARAAVMEYPSDARTAMQVIERAEAALERSLRLGGPAIVGIDWCPDHEAPPDVVIIDSDVELASTLAAALGRTGLDCIAEKPDTSRRSDTGVATATQSLPPRLVIVDVNSENGGYLDELRRLRRRYPPESTKLIVVSADVGLALIDQAFSLDAWDVVAKPFNLALLVRRVQRELQ